MLESLDHFSSKHYNVDLFELFMPIVNEKKIL